MTEIIYLTVYMKIIFLYTVRRNTSTSFC